MNSEGSLGVLAQIKNVLLACCGTALILCWGQHEPTAWQLRRVLPDKAATLHIGHEVTFATSCCCAEATF